MHLLHSILHLSLVHLSDFSFDFSNFKLKILDEEKFKQIILLLLKAQNCPFIIDLQNEMKAAIFLDNTRDLLIILAWLIQISGIFEKYHEKLLEKIAEDMDFKENEDNDSEIIDINYKKEAGALNKDNINENDFIESFTRIDKKFTKLFSFFEYKDKVRNKLQFEMQAQNIFLKINEIILIKNPKKIEKRLLNLEEISVFLEKEKENIKHEELFWLWMESVIDADKKDLLNDPYYGFSESKDSVNLINNSNQFKGIETLFEDLKDLNEKYNFFKEKIISFQGLWEKKKSLLHEGEDKQKKIEEFKTNSIKILSDFDKKFLTYEKMQALLQSNIPEMLIPNELLAIIPYEKNEKKEKINEKYDFADNLNKLNNENLNLKNEIQMKIKKIMDSLQNVFKIYSVDPLI